MVLISWSQPHTWNVGDLLTAAQMNAVSTNLNAVWHQESYTEFTAAVSVPSLTTVVTAPAWTGDGTRSASVWFYAPYAATDGTANDALTIYLYDGATSQGTIAQVKNATAAIINVPLGTFNIVLTGSRVPSAASHTYAIKANQASGTPSIQAGAGGVSPALMPGYIAVYSAAP